jgi:hypothetical protein
MLLFFVSLILALAKMKQRRMGKAAHGRDGRDTHGQDARATG